MLMKNFFKKYNLVFLLLILVVILIVLKIIYSDKSTKTVINNNVITPITTEVPDEEAFNPGYIKDQERLQKLSDESREKYPLAIKLPYTQNDFKISHYSNTMTLLVKIKDESKKSEIETKVNEWLVKNGFEAGSHKIEWKIVESF